MEGARKASGIERAEIQRWRDHHKKLTSDESLGWEGHLFSGYHIRKVNKDESTEYLKTDLPGPWAKLNTKINQDEG
ncbi:MAG: hypothetical protein ACRDQH_17150 [Pseudonocardiaceae bacterium]